MSKKKRKENTIVKQILDEFNPKSVEDVQDALKEVFGPLFEAMLQGEMNNHLGYENNNKDFKKLITVEMVMAQKHLRQLWVM